MPLTLLAFIGPSIYLLSDFFPKWVRWLFLLLLAVQQLLVRRRAMESNGFVFLLFLYTLWCITTTFWSEVFELSLYKSIMFFVMVFTMLYAGHSWVTRQGKGKCFDYLVPAAAVSYAAASLGYFLNPSAYVGDYYQGFVYGSNMLGALMYMSAPLVFWRLYTNWGSLRRRKGWMVICALGFVFILMSKARSSLLVALLVLGGYLLSLTRKKQVILVYLAVLLVALVLAVLPEASSSAVQRVVYKDQESIIFSRIQPWTESLQKAALGGWLGGGYGVSIGSKAWEGGTFTSVGYGREKGNAQMAIVEETGVVGLALYVMMIFSFFSALLARYLTIVDKDIKAALGISMGVLGGMVLQSFFEAWWVAPGSPESPVFWTLAGAALGLAELGRNQSLRSSGLVITQHQ